MSTTTESTIETTTREPGGARRGWWVALAALEAAGERGVPTRVLLALVTHVGQVSEATAYQTLRRELRAPGTWVDYSGTRGRGRSGMTRDSQVIRLSRYVGMNRPTSEWWDTTWS